MPAAHDDYGQRFGRVLDHIDAHLEGDLTVERLARVAAFSKFHFLRQFSALYGLSVREYVQLLRLKRASQQLAFRPELRVIDIALASGFDSHEAFSRAFKRVVGQTPSEFREGPGWESWHATFEPLASMRARQLGHAPGSAEVVIELFAETRVASLEHRGDQRRVGDSVRKFIAWRKQNGLPPRVSATFNVLHDDPDETPPDEHRFELCAATTRPVKENPFGVVEKSIPAGRCAVVRHTGPDDTLAETARRLYAGWLPESGEQLRDFPLFLRRVRFFPDVPEHEAVTDVLLPLG